MRASRVPREDEGRVHHGDNGRHTGFLGFRRGIHEWEGVPGHFQLEPVLPRPLGRVLTHRHVHAPHQPSVCSRAQEACAPIMPRKHEILLEARQQHTLTSSPNKPRAPRCPLRHTQCGSTKRFFTCRLTLRVQVPNNQILTPNLYCNYYSPTPKYQIIGYMDPLGKEARQEQRPVERAALWLHHAVLRHHLHDCRAHGAQPVGRGQGFTAANVCHVQHAGDDVGNLALQGALPTNMLAQGDTFCDCRRDLLRCHPYLSCSLQCNSESVLLPRRRHPRRSPHNGALLGAELDARGVL